MNRRWVAVTTLAAALLLAQRASAASGPEIPAPDACFVSAPASGLTPVVGWSAGGLFEPCDPGLEGIVVRSGSPRLESIRYRPRHRDRDRYSDYGWRSNGFSQIHAGFFDPDGDPPSEAMFGARVGTSIDDRVQLGIGVDLSHHSNRTTVLVREVELPSGGSAERETIVARSSSNLVPMMAFLQLTPGVDLPFTPYFGIGGGYEVLFLSAEDFRDPPQKFDATYGGWGWQVWGGASLPLSGRTRLAAEVFLNNSEVERDVDDPTTGTTLREIVPVDGVGMRFGLSWGF